MWHPQSCIANVSSLTLYSLTKTTCSVDLDIAVDTSSLMTAIAIVPGSSIIVLVPWKTIEG